MMLPNGNAMADTPKTNLRLSSPPSRVGGLAAARTGKTDLVRYPTQTSAVRALLETPQPGGDRKLRLTTRLLAPRPAPSEGKRPSTDARRILSQATEGIFPSASASPAQAGPRAEGAPQLAPLAIQDTEGLGQLLRIRRQILGLTQQQLAERAGVGRRFISELEGGKPTVELGRTLTVCRFLGLSLTAQQDHG